MAAVLADFGALAAGALVAVLAGSVYCYHDDTHPSLDGLEPGIDHGQLGGVEPDAGTVAGGWLDVAGASEPKNMMLKAHL